MQTYKHYQIDSDGSGVRVYDPRFPATPVMQFSDITAAKNWITGYRNGVQWAVKDKINYDLRRDSAGHP